MPGFPILFEDEQILVVNKPAGIGTQAPRQFDSLEARVRDYLETNNKPFATAEPVRKPYLGIPHRLDRCVSGAIVFAKRKKAAQRLAKQFERREVEKCYVAIVVGQVEPAAGTWTNCVRKIPELPEAEIVSCDHPDAKRAALSYETDTRSVLRCRSDNKLTRLNIRLETGRMHQIRVQCAERGHPVLGDWLYGNDTDAFGPDVSHDRQRHIALHAKQLSFDHPKSRERISFSAPFPATWNELWT